MKQPRNFRQQGFSLIEVLIAVLVLGVGLLGFAMLQTTSLRMTQSAGYRTQATNLANELLDQMRASRVSVAAYAKAAGFEAGAVPDACVPGVGAQSITAMTDQWKCQVRRALGNDASAQVSYNGNQVTVVLNWGDRIRSDVTEAEKTTSFTVTSRL